jgi:hypothetical protein
MHDRRRLLGLIEKVGRFHFPGSSVCIFFGSFAKGRGSPKSDIDIICLSPDEGFEGKHQHLHIAGWVFDVYVLSMDHLRYVIEEQCQASNTYFSEAVLGGHVVYDDIECMGAIRKHAKQCFDDFTGRRFSANSYRLSITCLIDNIEGSETFSSLVANTVDLYRALLRGMAARDRVSHGQSVIMSERIECAMAGTSTNDLAEAMAAQVAGNGLPLSALATSFLDEIGGRFRSGEFISLGRTPRKCSERSAVPKSQIGYGGGSG